MDYIDITEIKKKARQDNVKLKHVAARLGIPPSQLSKQISGDYNTGYKTINKILLAIKDITEGK